MYLFGEGEEREAGMERVECSTLRNIE